MQLAGHLRSKALQEWGLMIPDEKKDYHTAVTTLQAHLDPGNKTLAALDFCHITQKENESVSDFIMRLERMFQIAFGRDHMSLDTRDVLLYGKLQNGLRIDLHWLVRHLQYQELKITMNFVLPQKMKKGDLLN